MQLLEVSGVVRHKIPKGLLRAVQTQDTGLPTLKFAYRQHHRS